MVAELNLVINFGIEGDSRGYLAGGWAAAEPAFTWALGAESHLVVTDAAVNQDYILTLDVIPFVVPPLLPVQRLIVSVNGVVVGSSAVARSTLLGYRVPASVMVGTDRLVITIRHPDAVRPIDFDVSADTRLLAFSISEARLYKATDDRPDPTWCLPPGIMIDHGGQSDLGMPAPIDLASWVTDRTGLNLPGLALQFESVGENCEFGLVQRACDAEPLGLLRFSSTFLHNLIRGLDDGFGGLGEIEDIEPRLEGDTRREYMIHEKRYGLVYHTFVYEGQRSLWLMREQESARLRFLRRKFLEELEVAEKIFIYKRNSPVLEAEILPLYLALRMRGDNTLLWVVPAERNRPAGTVEVVMPGLLKGYIDRFATDANAHDFSFEGWMRICANALVLMRLAKGQSQGQPQGITKV